MNRFARASVAVSPPLALVCALALVLVSSREAGATPRWSEADYQASLAAEAARPPGAGGSGALAAPSGGPIDYFAEYIQSAHFLTLHQVDDPLDPEFGGEREAEHLSTIVQSDNTQEVIWVWSRLAADYGIDSLLYRVANAWTYIGNFPGYLEEGGTDPDSGYYRVYNCGWGLRAEMEYRRSTGDERYRAYGDSCAEYLMTNPLNLHGGTGTGFYSRVNGPVEAWAMGNLYDYGLDVGNAAYTTAATATADSIVTWVEEDSTRLAADVWAMSGGATMWGILRAYFSEHPSETAAWVATYAPNLGLQVPGGQFANAWNNWNALAQWELWVVSADGAYLDAHQALTDSLIARDGDDDGGIPARYVDTDGQDQTWITNYLCFMCLDRRRQLTSSVAEAVLPPSAGVVVSVAGPNPFRESTAIRFRLPAPGPVRLEIADVRGRRVWSSGPEMAPAGHRAIIWQGRDDAGRAVPAGVYFYRLVLPEGSSGGKLLLGR